MTPDGLGKRASIRDRLLPGLFFLSALVTSAVPRLTWLFVICAAIALIGASLWRRENPRDLLRPSLALLSLLLVTAYLFVNAAWAADQTAALGAAALTGALVLVSFASSNAMEKLDAEQLGRISRAFVIGALLGTLFLGFELLTNASITRFALTWLPVKEESAKHVKFLNGHLSYFNRSNLNQNAAIVTFNLWPALLALNLASFWRHKWLQAALFLLATVVPVALSEHQSSQLAIMASVPAYLLARQWPLATIRGLAVLWCLGFALVLPVDFAMYKADWHLAPWMTSSFRARIIIWEYTAERVLEHPWRGIGAASTPALRTKANEAEKPPGFVYPRTTGWHAHDIFLQTWYELGLVGVLLVAFAGACVALRMSLLPSEAQAFAAASFTTFMAVGAFAWGMWQNWLNCAVVLLLIYFHAGSALAAKRIAPSPKAQDQAAGTRD